MWSWMYGCTYLSLASEKWNQAMPHRDQLDQQHYNSNYSSWEIAWCFGICPRWRVVSEWDHWGGTATYGEDGADRTEKDIDEDCHSHPTTGTHWKNAVSEIKAQGKELFKVFFVTKASPITVSRAWWPDDRMKPQKLQYASVASVLSSIERNSSQQFHQPKSGQNGDWHWSLQKSDTKSIEDLLVCLYCYNLTHSSSQSGFPQACNAAQSWVQLCSQPLIHIDAICAGLHRQRLPEDRQKSRHFCTEQIRNSCKFWQHCRSKDQTDLQA